MRTAFIAALEELAAADPSVVLMTGDLGFGVLDDYRERFPDQFYNVGVAEQNLSGIAAGLALTGHTVFTYSIGNFPTLRCLEQVRNDVCYHRAEVKIVTVGGGMAYGSLGPSHFATEDLAILRALPEIAVVAPGDPVEAAKLTPQVAAREGPVYLRLGRRGEPDVHDADAEIVLGRPAEVRPGDDVLLLSAGGMLPVAAEAAERLSREDGLEAAVASVHTLDPLDAGWIADRAAGYPAVVTCEEHVLHGGLGGAVAEVLAEAGIGARLRRIGLDGRFAEGVGSQEHMRRTNGLDARAVAEAARAALG